MIIEQKTGDLLWKLRAVAINSDAPVTIAQYEREIWVYHDHRDGAEFFTDLNSQRVYMSLCETVMSDVDRWHDDNTPYYIEFNHIERIDGPEMRRWIEKNTSGVFSIWWPHKGVRFEKWEDAFWFKMMQT